MSKSNTFENDLLKLIFNGVAIANLADNAAASPLTTLYVSLHSADPGEAGNQSTSELTYPEYARVAVARGPGGWIVTADSVSPMAAIEFPEQVTGTASTANYASVGTAAGGTGKILYSGALSPTIACNVGVVPRIRTTSTISED